MRQADRRYASVQKIERHARTTMLARGTCRCRIDQRAFYRPPHLALKARHRASARRRASCRLLLRGTRGRFFVDLLRRLCRLRAHGRRLRLRRHRSGFWWSNLCRRWRDLRGRWSNLRLFGYRGSFRDHRRRICRCIGRRRWSGHQRDLHGRCRRLLPCRALGQPAHDGKNTEALQQ